MPCPVLNEYNFTFRHGGLIENHREINNTLSRATKKAVAWIAECFANAPDGSLACRVTIGEPVPAVDVYIHAELPEWMTEDMNVPTMDE
jgi:hypothetical protein